MALESRNHTRFNLKYHFVWCPKYRRLLLKGNVGKYLVKVINEVAERFDYHVLELAVMPDHIHLFLSATPKDSASCIMRRIKSITATKLFKRFSSIKKILWGGKMWARGYFVMTSGEGTTDEMVRRYIKEQRDDLTATDQPNLFG